MDIYEATQAFLEASVPQDVNVSSFVLTYDALTDQFSLPEFPAVTYNYSLLSPIVAHDGTSNLFRANLDITVWGDLGQIDEYAMTVMDSLNANRVTVNNVEFTLAVNSAQDVAELGLDFKRRVMRFVGLIAVGEETVDDSN